MESKDNVSEWYIQNRNRVADTEQTCGYRKGEERRDKLRAWD